MPCEDDNIRCDVFNSELVVIADLIGQHPDCYVIIGGISMWIFLEAGRTQVCLSSSVMIMIYFLALSNKHEKSSVDHTYQFDMK